MFQDAKRPFSIALGTSGRLEQSCSSGERPCRNPHTEGKRRAVPGSTAAVLPLLRAVPCRSSSAALSPQQAERAAGQQNRGDEPTSGVHTQ